MYAFKPPDNNKRQLKKETPTQRAFLAQNNVYKKSPQKVKHFLRTFN